jgi:hypothetical protein
MTTNQRVRFFFAALAPCLPSAVLVFFGNLEMVFFLVAARAAFLMFLRAAAFCFAVAIGISESGVLSVRLTARACRRPYQRCAVLSPSTR